MSPFAHTTFTLITPPPPISYAHYKSKYGQTPEGFLAYVQEQIGALRKCEARGDYTPRECALYFEALGNDEEQLFFHADQVCGELPSFMFAPGSLVCPLLLCPAWSAIGAEHALCIIDPSAADHEGHVRDVFGGLASSLPAEFISHHQVRVEWGQNTVKGLRISGGLPLFAAITG